MPNPRKLEVYQIALSFSRIAKTVIEVLPKGLGDLGNQLRRASASIVLNIAEGFREFKPKEKARFYRMARRSATECFAIVDVASIYQDDSTMEEARGQLDRIQAMLTRLILNLDASV